MKWLVVALVLLSTQAHATQLRKEMLGRWASEPEACKEQSSELGMTVEPRSVLFYEHGYSVQRIVRQRDGSLKGFGYSFDEQGKTKASITLKLVGDKLEAKGQIYHRCEKR